MKYAMPCVSIHGSHAHRREALTETATQWQRLIRRNSAAAATGPKTAVNRPYQQKAIHNASINKTEEPNNEVQKYGQLR